MRKTAFSSYLKKQHYNVQKQQIKIKTWDCRKFKSISKLQCWTKGRSSTAVAEDLGPTATATVAEV